MIVVKICLKKISKQVLLHKTFSHKSTLTPLFLLANINNNH